MVDEVVVARDIHTSILTALILTGAHPIYVTPRFNSTASVQMKDATLRDYAFPGGSEWMSMGLRPTHTASR